MVNWFFHTYQLLMAHKRWATYCLLGLIAVFVFLALNINYEEDIARFLPRNEQSERYNQVYQGLSGQNRIVVVFSGNNTDSIELAMDQFETILSENDEKHLLESMQIRVDETQMLNVMSFILQNEPFFVTEADWQRIDSLLGEPGFVASQLEENKQMLQLPTAGSMLEAMRYDPLHLFTPILSRLQSFKMSDSFIVLDGYVFTQDGKTALAFLTSAYGMSESLHNNELNELLNSVMAQTHQAFPDVKVSAVGAPLIAVGNANQIKADSLAATLIALTLILLLLFLHYRRLSDMCWIGASIAFGWLFAIAVMSLFRDSISIIVLGVGSVIIGIAVNYPLHYLNHLKETGNRIQTLKDMAPPLLIGNITTVSAFLCLVWLDAAAMRDLGWFGSLMLIGTILFVLVFMPLYVKPSKQAGRGGLNISLDMLKLNSKTQRRVFLLVITVVTVVLGWYSLDTSFDSDIRHINYMTDEQREGLQMLSDMSGDASVYVVAEGATLDEALRRNEQVVCPQLALLSEQKQIGRVSGVGSFLPSLQAQRDLCQRWNEYWAVHREQVLSELHAETVRQGFSSDVFEPFETMISQPVEPRGMDSFQPVMDFMTNAYIQTEGDRTRVVNFIQTAHEDEVKAAVSQSAKDGDVFAFSGKDISNQLVQLLSDSFNYIGFVCGFVVFLFLWLSFGSVELALLSFLPLAVSWLCILGAMQLLGVQFNIVNIILATFIFGQGDDYTIFITEGLITEHATGRKRLDSYKRSVALSAVIMFIGIGTLMIAKHPALRSLAEVTVIGMLTVVMMAFYLPPIVFHWITRRSDGSCRPVPLTLKRIVRSAYALGFFLLGIAFMLPYTWFYFRFGKNTEERKLRYHRLLQRICRYIIYHVPGTEFRLDNRYNETFSRPSVIICNHQSQLDLMCLIMLTPKVIFMTKDWVWHNPLYGGIIHHAEYYPVSNGIENHIDELRSVFERGYSIAIFPEGTRSTDCRIHRFHKGAFYLAQQLGADVLPIFLHGAGHVLPKTEFMLREGRIDVRIERRIGVNDPRFSTDLLSRTKEFRHYYMSYYDEMCRELETPEYFASFVRYQYMFKGMAVERCMHKNLRNALAELQTVSYAGQLEIRLTDNGQGEKALLVALCYPKAEVYAVVSGEEEYEVAVNVAGKPQNLHYQRV
jgi:1-acyl-sn-glycerol-3-phosphate acyltransferase